MSIVTHHLSIVQGATAVLSDWFTTINICNNILWWNISQLRFLFSSVQSLSHVWLFVTPWTAAHQAFQYINSWSLLKLMPIELVMPSNHLFPFSSCLQSFPASGFFPMSQFFSSGGQIIEASASAPVLPMNIQD